MSVFSWFTAAKPAAPPAVRAGTRVYAIGDIHGRLDLLERLQSAITADAAQAPRDLEIQTIFLGDYIDRGPHSREVVDFLLDAPAGSARSVHLLGNHEASLLAFLDRPETAGGWLRFGGDATLRSYGLAVDPSATPGTIELKGLRDGLAARMPERHLNFFSKLRLSFRNGDYFFAHAGIDPKRPLDEQTAESLIWSRDDFTACTKFHGAVVVHGHTIAPEPIVRPNRIGIDTGAYRTGRLTCLVLEGTERRFLSTGS